MFTLVIISSFSCLLRIEDERRSSSFASFGSTQGEAADTMPDMPNGVFNPIIGAFNPIKCALGIANGMRYLHSHDMVHCDLKTANVVLDSELNAKITDFGDVEVYVKYI